MRTQIQLRDRTLAILIRPRLAIIREHRGIVASAWDSGRVQDQRLGEFETPGEHADVGAESVGGGAPGRAAGRVDGGVGPGFEGGGVVEVRIGAGVG